MDSDWLDGLAGAATFLASALLKPHGADLVAALSEPGLLQSWPLPADDAANSGLVAWHSAVAQPVATEELTADYARLFVGPGRAFVWPYESVHRSDEGLVFEQQTLEVRAAYAEFGWAAPRLGREPDDHLGLELHFVALLAEAILSAREAGEPDARPVAALSRFAHEHIVSWAAVVADAMIEHAQTDFYRGAGFLIRSLVSQFEALEK